MASLNLLDWAIFGLYLVLVFWLGMRFARQYQSKADYFLGGRNMTWLPVGLSLFATIFSSLSFVGMPREAAYADYHLFLAVLFIPLVVTPIVSWLFLPVYYRLKLASPYQYLGMRFGKPVQVFASLLFSLYAIGWMGNMLYAVGVILQRVLNLTPTQLTWTLVGLGLFATLYTSLGGVKAVIWTDVLQVITLGGGTLVVLLFAVSRIDGGWATIAQLGMEYDKFNMFDMELRFSGPPTFYAACAFAMFVYLAWYIAAYTAVQRYVSMPSLAVARRAMVINGVLVGGVCLLFFLVGTTLFAFYHQGLSTGAVAGSGFPELPKQDQLLPHFILTEIPRFGLTGLLIAGLFAAAMSSVDSGINSVTATIVYDWLSVRELKLAFTKFLCAMLGLTVIVSALLVPYLGEHVFDIVIKISGTFMGLLLGVFLLGLFVPRANTPGAIFGLLAGMAALVTVWTLTDVSHWWYGAVACIPTFAVGILTSLLFPPPDSRQLQDLLLTRSQSQ